MAAETPPAARRSLWRLIEAALQRFDNEERELVVRFRLWKGRWFGYRQVELLGIDEEGEPIFGPWEPVQPTARVFKHTTACSIWRRPWRKCNCGRRQP